MQHRGHVSRSYQMSWYFSPRLLSASLAPPGKSSTISLACRRRYRLVGPTGTDPNDVNVEAIPDMGLLLSPSPES